MPYRRRVAADATSAAASCAAAPRCCALRLPQPIQRRARSARAAPRGGGQRAAQQRVFLLQAVVLNAQVEHHALLPRLRTMAAVRARSGAHARFQHHGMQRAFICLLLAMRATSRPPHRVSACPHLAPPACLGFPRQRSLPRRGATPRRRRVVATEEKQQQHQRCVSRRDAGGGRRGARDGAKSQQEGRVVSTAWKRMVRVLGLFSDAFRCSRYVDRCRRHVDRIRRANARAHHTLKRCTCARTYPAAAAAPTPAAAGTPPPARTGSMAARCARASGAQDWQGGLRAFPGR